MWLVIGGQRKGEGIWGTTFLEREGARRQSKDSPCRCPEPMGTRRGTETCGRCRDL